MGDAARDADPVAEAGEAAATLRERYDGLRRIEERIADLGRERVEAAADAYRQAHRVIEQYGDDAVGSGDFAAYVQFEGEFANAVDVDDDALAFASEFGADATVNPADCDGVGVPERVRARTDGGADVSVDALGIAETCRNSVRSLRPRGTHVQIGLTTDEERGEVSLPTDWMTRWEISFLGSRGMPPTSYGDLFALIEATDVDPGALVTRELSLSEVSERLEAMGEYGVRGVEVVTDFAG